MCACTFSTLYYLWCKIISSSCFVLCILPMYVRNMENFRARFISIVPDQLCVASATQTRFNQWKNMLYKMFVYNKRYFRHNYRYLIILYNKSIVHEELTSRLQSLEKWFYRTSCLVPINFNSTRVISSLSKSILYKILSDSLQINFLSELSN